MNRLTRLMVSLLMAAGGFMAIARPVAAVSTSYWTQANEADFKAGTLESVVATSLGELKLSRTVKTVMEQDPNISTVNKLAEAPDGTIYAGTGPNAMLLQIKDQKVTTVAHIEDATDILSLAFDMQGRLLIGTAGEKGRVLRIDKPGEKPHDIFSAPGVQYIWALQTTPDGSTYAASGPDGKLFEIKPDGSSKVLFESGENNLLSLISDGKDLLYVGTDPHGLVYRINRKSGESFVLYNAAESEVTALALDRHGNLFAATAEARDESPAPAQTPSDQEKNGSPQGGSTGVPIPGENPKQPKPPTPPDPNPGRPDPIPKNPQAGAGDRNSDFNGGLAGVAACVARGFQPDVASRQLAFSHVIFAMADAGGGPDNPKRKPHPGPPAPTPGPGKPQPPPQQPGPQTAPSEIPGPGHQPPVDVNATGEPRPEGNAVYKIDTEGFVTEIFRQPVLVLAMVENNGTLLIATGSDGQIYQLNLAAGETGVLAKVDSKQVTCLLPARDGNIYVGMANVGSIATMSAGYANKGTYTSPVLDATQISKFGKMQLRGSLPARTSLTVSTRSGNVRDASENSWSKWTEPVPAVTFLPLQSPSARFLQYRLTLESESGKATPVVDNVAIAYQVPNMAPQIKAIHLIINPGNNADNGNGNAPAGDNSGNDRRRVESSHMLTISWEASDANNDALEYSLFFRRGINDPWILLKDKFTDTSFDWDTRSVADGRYQVRVIASDANANPVGMGKTATRVSESVLIDNTPPIIGDLQWQQKGALIHVDLRTYDRSSTVAAVDYVVDSDRKWQLVLPVGGIYDSPEEAIAFDIRGLEPGKHQVTLRATDSKGNISFENMIVKVEGPAASR